MLTSETEFAFIRLCFRDPALWAHGVRPVDPLAEWAVSKVLAYRGEYNRYPSLETFLAYVRPECGPQQMDLLSANLSREWDRDFILKSVLTFVEEQKMRRAVHDGLQLLDSGDVQGARATISEGLTMVSSPAFDYFREEMVHQKHEAIGTGFVNLDGVMLGGARRRKLGLVMGPRSSGKSMVLLNFGVGAMYLGHRVLHLTLEDSLESVVKRYDTRLSGFGAMPTRRVQRLYGGNLMIKEFMTGQATVADFCSYMEPRPDVVLVDYLDEVKPSKPYKARRHELGDVARGLRAMAQRYDCVVWTAKQTGRGTKFSKELTNAEDSFEGYEPVQVADLALVINQTYGERQDGTMRLTLDKNKDGPDGRSVLFKVDYRRMLMKVGDGSKV